MSSDVGNATHSAITIARLTYSHLRNDLAVPSWTRLTAAEAGVLRAHPHAGPDDTAVIGALRNAQPLGRLIMIPGRASVNGKTVALSWSSGWEADANAPGTGSLLLLGALRAAGSFGACLMSSDALRVMRAARWPLVRMPRFVLLRRSADYWRQALPSPVARVLAPPTDLALAAVRRLSSLRRGRDRRFAVEEVPTFDEQVDAIDSDRAEKLYFRRDHLELNWAMTNVWDAEARARYRGFIVRERASADVLGYALTRTRSYGPARVASLFRTAVRSGQQDALRSMIDSVIAELVTDDPDLIDIAGTDPAIPAIARGWAMIRHGGIDVACRFGPAGRDDIDLRGFRLDMAEGDVLLL